MSVARIEKEINEYETNDGGEGATPKLEKLMEMWGAIKSIDAVNPDVLRWLKKHLEFHRSNGSATSAIEDIDQRLKG